jgi:excisionase family DNA binding protein
MEERFYTVKEVAKILNISPYTVYFLVKIGDLKGIRIGWVIRVPESALKRYIENNRIIVPHSQLVWESLGKKK